MLLAYGFLALTDFSNDKVAYVYDTLLSHSVSVSRQVRSELDFMANRVKFYMKGFNFTSGQLHPYSKYNFGTEHKLKGLWVFSLMRSNDLALDSIIPEKLDAERKKNIETLSAGLISDLKDGDEISLRTLDSSGNGWLLGLKVEDKNSGIQVALISLVEQSYFADGIVSSSMQDTFLIDGKGKILIGPSIPNFATDLAEIGQAIDKAKESTGNKSGITEVKSGNESSDWLISISNVGVGSLSVVSLVSKDVATGAIQVLLVKSLFFLLVILSVTVVVSVLTSRKLTSALKSLLESTRRVATGDFLVESKVKSRDEVGELARGFNLMTVEIRRLMSETAEKARMEGELLTARTVQATLFPELSFNSEKVSIRGYYQPASECGGDWFFYNKKGSRTYMLIGDATGHGVPAALVTAAAKSASRVIDEFEELGITRLAEILNRAIYETSKARVMMTFFLGCFDEETNEFTYVNASHDPPFLLKQSQKELKKKDIIPLLGKTNRRFGEKMDSIYEANVVQLRAGDKIVFYTDGVTELVGDDKKMWGERRFIKTLLESHNSRHSIDESMADLMSAIEDHRKGEPLDDDLTYFIFENNEKAPTLDV